MGHACVCASNMPEKLSTTRRCSVLPPWRSSARTFLRGAYVATMDSVAIGGHESLRSLIGENTMEICWSSKLPNASLRRGMLWRMFEAESRLSSTLPNLSLRGGQVAAEGSEDEAEPIEIEIERGNGDRILMETSEGSEEVSVAREKHFDVGEGKGEVRAEVNGGRNGADAETRMQQMEEEQQKENGEESELESEEIYGGLTLRPIDGRLRLTEINESLYDDPLDDPSLDPGVQYFKTR